MANQQPTILITAGASGGHIFPALSVADELKKKGYHCHFVGGGAQFEMLVGGAGYSHEALPTRPFNGRNPMRKVLALVTLAQAFLQAIQLVKKHQPLAVFGTGGYATVAMMLAAKFCKVPTIVHEQNVLPGRANRLLSGFVDVMLTAFETVPKKLKSKAENTKVVGNPVRQSVLDARTIKRADDGLFHLLVVGGSQGARVFSEIVPQAVAMLSEALRDQLMVTQQARPEDCKEVTETYERMGIPAKVAPFFADLPQELAKAHLLISRAGTSSVTECALLGRAALFVPLELADGHQIYNAKVLSDEHAALLIRHDDFTPERAAKELEKLITQPSHIYAMEKRAATLGQPDAALRAAQEIENLIQQKKEL